VTYFRAWEESEDPNKLLDPDEQLSTPWGEPRHGRCEKCDGSGRVAWRCRSCLAGGGRHECAACQGRITFVDRCPSCEGTGEVTRTTREGVSVVPTIEGLYLYLAERGGEADGKVIVELDGPLSGDVDLDAEAGALLVKPERVVAVRPLRDDLMREAADRVRKIEPSA
jgi:hypothetical protein